MTNQEAIDKMEFCKRAYQRMIDENSQEGVFVGKGFEGKWKADTPLYKAYEDMRDACDMAIKALSQEPLTEEDYIELHDRFGDYVVFVVRDMISGKGERWKQKNDNNPQEPKMGHPQKSCDTCEHSDEIDGSNCYECVKDMRNNYSPKKMVEPPESEVQDVDKCTYEETGCGSCKMQLNCPRSR